MSSAPTQIAVSPSASLVTQPQIQKDFLEEPLPRQNSLGNRHRGGQKGKHLTRSHAMREATSPPRTPTPRSELLTPTSPSGLSSSSPETVIDSRLHVQHSSSTSSSPLLETPSIIVPQHHHNNNQQQQQQQLSPPQIFSTDGGGNQSQLDLDFPKLTPPKSKSPRSNNNNFNNNNHNNNHNNINNNNNNNNINNNCNASRDSDKTSNTNEHNKIMFSSGTDSMTILSQHNNNNGNINNMQVTDSSSLVTSSQTSSTITTTSNVPPPNSYDKENRYPRENNNYNTNNNHNHSSNNLYQNDDSLLHCDSPTDGLIRGFDRLKKHRSGGGAKSNKPRLKTMGSSSSVEGGNNSSGFISRDSSTEQFTDQSGVDLLQFFKETLNKNPKDRNMLIKIEKDLLSLALDRTRNHVKFPPMSSYNRMLIHRVAAYFGMEHNVDATQQSVIAAVTKSTRVPDVHFKSLIKDTFTEERKSILKRDAHSFDECRQFLGPDRGVLDRKAKSFEEREEEYEKVRRRIFRGREVKADGSVEEHHWPWSSTDSSENSSRLKVHHNRLLKVHSVESRNLDGRPPCVSKSHSFGGYGGQSQTTGPLMRGDSVTSTKSAGPRLFTKQDSTGSTNTPWRLSPSSSGYKTQSIRSDSVTPSPNGYGSGDHTPEPSVVQSPASSTCGIVWAVTDMAVVPRGSVLIDPQTLQPIVNQDGTIYHFDPSNLPPTNMSTKPPTIQRKKFEKQKSIKSIEPGTEYDLMNNKNENNIIQNVINESVESITVITDNESQILTKELEEEEEEEAEPLSPTLEDDNIQNTLQITTNGLLNTDDNQKLQKNQATSPNLPSPEFQPTQLNEISTSNGTNSPDIIQITTVTTQNSQNNNNNNNNNNAHNPNNNINNNNNNTIINTSNNNINNNNNTNNNTNNNNDTTTVVNHTSIQEQHKKDEYIKPVQSSSIPVMSYATSYSSIENGTTVFQGAPTAGPFPTYQQGADGSVYAMPQPMMYAAYPSQMESEVPYFLPIYDQTGAQQRDTGNLLTTQTPTASIYPQTASTTTTVLPLAAYPPPTMGTPLYQGQVLYTQDQFTTQAAAAAAASGQMQQYPLTYPMGYPYTYNGATTYPGYWGQPMTYYVPQHQLTPAATTTASTSMVVPSSTATGLITQNSTSVCKRSTPPHHHHHHQNHTNQQTTTLATPYGTASVQIPITDPTGGTTAMYTIPPHMYPSMLPYATSATAGVLPHLPHQQNSVINSVVPQQMHTADHSTIMTSHHSSYNQLNSNQNNNNPNTTPQSTPSTPLSLPLPLPHQKNPPLFATPPIIQNGFTPQLGQVYQNGDNYINGSGVNGGGNTYERKNNGYTNNRRTNHNTQIHNPTVNRQNTYFSQQNHNLQRKTYDNSTLCTTTISNNTNTNNRNNVNNNINNNIVQQKQRNITENLKPQTQIIPSNYNNINNNGIGIEKPRGQRPKPANLDLRRNNNNSNRNTPSTNSTESNNNSPNSITSNDQPPMYITRGSHMPPMHHHHHPQATIDPSCHQQLISTYNPAAGMYVKFGSTYFTHPSMTLPSNRRSPPNDVRPQLTQITGMYPTMNVMLPDFYFSAAPRHIAPRPQHNPNYKGNKTQR